MLATVFNCESAYVCVCVFLCVCVCVGGERPNIRKKMNGRICCPTEGALGRYVLPGHCQASRRAEAEKRCREELQERLKATPRARESAIR